MDKFEFGKTIVTTPGKLIFPVLGKPKAFKEKEKWSAGLVVKPSPKLDELLAEVNKVGEALFGKKWKTDPSKFEVPVQPGQAILDKIAAKGKTVSDKTKALYSGNFYISSNANVLNAKKQPLEAPSCYTQDKSKLPRRPGNQDDIETIERTFYPGAYTKLAITPLAFEVGKTLGVKLILKGVMFVKDGERIGGEDIDTLIAESFEDDSFEFGDETDVAFGEPTDTLDV